MSSTRAMRVGLSVLGACVMVTLLASPVSAQVVVSGGVDLTNQYNFRGIRQNFSGVSIWPFIDFGFTPFMGDGTLKTVGVNVGTWNAFNSEIDGFTNRDGETTSNKWYESDIYGTVALGFGPASLGFTYTAYTSPANLFATVNELAVKLTGTAGAGGVAFNPYALVAFELSDDGQADGGTAKGTYIELGVAPGFSGSRASLTVPIKVGLSGSNYFEHNMGTALVPNIQDETFGYFSLAGVVTVPMGKFNVHGGAEFQKFGDTLKAKNSFGDDDGDPSGTALIGSIGIGFTF